MNKSIHTKLYQRMIARLRAKREEKGVTQMQLAEKLGVNQTFVSKVEICERRLDIVELLTICEILEIPFVDFIKEIGKMETLSNAAQSATTLHEMFPPSTTAQTSITPNESTFTDQIKLYDAIYACTESGDEN